MEIPEMIHEMAVRARAAAAHLRQMTTAEKNALLLRLADALEAALSEVEKSGSARRIVTLGRLIHNDEYLRSVSARGAECASRDDIPDLIRAAEAGEEITLLIRAHGEKKETVQELEAVAERVRRKSARDG